ncbi:hypothetical protein [Klugiella xanthotipulae]|uniref:hypothetical protein n=1 Tax=Klugiella xanthotipulae TaxID=244735 RepID=UPI001B884FED|nr:hypothetical protein [Klugiella xanthotipulae]
MNLAKDVRRAANLVRKALRRRRDRADTLALLSERGELPSGRFRIAVYFADDRVNAYQLRQWYAPLALVSRKWPVLVIARTAGGARVVMEETDLEVAYAPKIVDIERVVAEQSIQLVFYVNQNTRNFQMMRYGQMWHVFINHGESDKMYMSTNQFKTYDYSLIAGEAARSRLGKALWNFDLDAKTIQIGRPQTDHFIGAVPYPKDDRITVLYAPTWEGDRPAAAYGSIVSHGVPLVRALLASPRHRVVYRPHPRSGAVDPGYGEANQQIIRMIAEENKATPSAHHFFDNGRELGWQILDADVAISDVSAMVYDRLAVGRPLFVTRPVSQEADVDISGYLSQCEWLEASEATDILCRVDVLLTDEVAQDRLATWSHHHFGDTTPGAPTARFHAAIERMLSDWDEWKLRSGQGVEPAAPTRMSHGSEDFDADSLSAL